MNQMMVDSENYYTLASEEAMRGTTQGDVVVGNTLETQANRLGYLNVNQQVTVSD